MPMNFSGYLSLADDHLNRIEQFFGDEGRQWIDDYPQTLETCVSRWNLELKERLEGGFGANQIFAGVNHLGENVVLKMGVPNPELNSEIATLQIYDGSNSVKLLQSDSSMGALLLQRIEPGTMLKGFASNEEETRIAAGFMQRLPREPASDSVFPHFSEWALNAFSEFRNKTPEQFLNFSPYVEMAETLFLELSGTEEPDALLHGDLHHENILFDTQKGWLVIDPKGVIGKPVLEAGRFLQNFFKTDAEENKDKKAQVAQIQIAQIQVAQTKVQSIKDQVTQRVRIISQVLKRDQDEILKAGMVDLIMSSCWTINSWSRSTEQLNRTPLKAPDMNDKLELADIYATMLRLSPEHN